MYTLTVSDSGNHLAPGTFTLEFRGLLEAAETYKMLVANGLAAHMITVTEPSGFQIDLASTLSGMARMLLPEDEQTDTPWWATA